MRLLIVLVVALVAGCASETGIVKIGNGLYMTSKQDRSFNSYAGTIKVDLYRQANEFCSKDGKKIMPAGDSSADATITSYAYAEIKFRCE